MSIIYSPKSEQGSVKRLHDYLYGKIGEGKNVDELIEIYEEIDRGVTYLEEDSNYEEELVKLQEDIRGVIKNFKKLKRDEILEELNNIVEF